MLKVLMAAGDTFRAAASEQLEVWAQRTGSEIVMGEGPKPRPATGMTFQTWYIVGYMVVHWMAPRRL